MPTEVRGRALTVREVRGVLDTPRLGLNDLARAAGVSRSALEAYRAGRSQPPMAVRVRLAGFLERHAKRVGDLAQLLRTAR